MSAITLIKGEEMQQLPRQHNPESGAAGDVYGRLIALREEKAGVGRKRKGKVESSRFLTQNVRGFKQENQFGWLRAWRRIPVRERPVAWLLQETQISSEDEASTLEEAWKQLWGKQNEKDGPRLSYWSVHSSKVGGVAILLNPDHSKEAKAWSVGHWTNRGIAVRIGGQLVVNVYAPNVPVEREAFWKQLRQWQWPRCEIVLAGDFNCVQSPPLDRRGEQQGTKPESPALRELVRHLDLEDAVTLEGAVNEDEEYIDPTEFCTYWGAECASRIYRFYVPTDWTNKVHWVEVKEPAAPSDHQCVCLHLRNQRQQHQRQLTNRLSSYPIRSSRPARVHAEQMAEPIERGVGKGVTSRTWDRTAVECVHSIKKIQRQERRRRKKAKHRANAQNRAHLLTRRDLLHQTEEDVRENTRFV